MKRLPDSVKRRIIEHLACYRTHAEVVQLIADEFGIALTSRHVRAYDPHCHQYVGSNRWLEHFDLVRERYAKEIGSIAITHRAYRLTQLQQLLDDAMKSGNFRQAMQVLAQAAREMAQG